MLSIAFCVVFLLAEPSLATYRKLDTISHFTYGDSNVDCDVLGPQGCLPLSDLWGYLPENSARHYVVVGASNGWDVIETTNLAAPRRVSFYPGCLNLWRDIKFYKQYAYAISEGTATCSCLESAPGVAGKCKTTMTTDEPGLGPFTYTASKHLPPFDVMSGQVAVTEPWDQGACLVVFSDVSGKIALVNENGDCMLGTKIQVLEDAGAVGVIVVSSENDYIFPGMTGGYSGKISAVLVAKNDGMQLKARAEQAAFSVEINSTHREESPYFTPPEGLLRMDLSDPSDPKVKHYHQIFDTAHNVLVDEQEGILYVCGAEKVVGFNNGTRVGNGSALMFDLKPDPSNPQYLGAVGGAYVHDMAVKTCNGTRLLVLAHIYQDEVSFYDVNDPLNPVELLRFSDKMGSSHNVALDDACKVLFVTHEDDHHPITAWRLIYHQNNTINWNAKNNPSFIGSLSINQFQGTIPHNVFVQDQFLWCSYYSEGTAVWDISNPYLPVLTAHLDHSSYSEGFHGAWGVWAHDSRRGSRLGFTSDIENGLWITEMVDTSAPVDAMHAVVGLVVLVVLLSLTTIITCVICIRQRKFAYSTV